MPISYLRQVNKLVLVAGHSTQPGEDPGAVFGQTVEAARVVKMTEFIAQNLRSRGIKVDVAPHNLDLGEAIAWLNANYPAFDTNRSDNVWAVEVHSDSSSVNQEVANRQTGVYYYQGDGGSQSIAQHMVNLMKNSGAHPNSWAWGHGPTSWRPYPLGWIQNTRALSHLIELGFVQGRNDENHLKWLAQLASRAIFESMTDQNYNNYNNSPQPEPTKPIEQPKSVAATFDRYVYTQQSIADVFESYRTLKYPTDDGNAFGDLRGKIWIDQIPEIIRELIERLNRINQDKNRALSELAIARNTISVMQQMINRHKDEIVDLQKQNNKLLSQQLALQKNPAQAPFYQSREWWADFLTKSLSAIIIVWQTAQIAPEDTWQNILIKLGSAAASVLGISAVTSVYLKDLKDVKVQQQKNITFANNPNPSMESPNYPLIPNLIK